MFVVAVRLCAQAWMEVVMWCVLVMDVVVDAEML
jgi:hypothetical protein